MAFDSEALTERTRELPEDEAKWILGCVHSVTTTLANHDQFPDILFDGRPYDEQTAQLRLFQYHQDSIERGLSDAGRQTIFDIAIDFGIDAQLPVEVVQANWQIASQETKGY